MKKETKPISINDLKEIENGDGVLSPQQRLAIKNFERHRFKTLSVIKSEEKFHLAFRQLQIQANLTDYTEFLKDQYLT